MSRRAIPTHASDGARITLAPGACPRCRYVFDVVTPSGHEDNEAVPSPGDFSVCIGCGAVLVFDALMRVRLATLDEMKDAPPEIAKIVRAVVVVGMTKPNRRN